MIENDEQLQQTWEALGDLYRALASYRSKILPVNPHNMGMHFTQVAPTGSSCGACPKPTHAL